MREPRRSKLRLVRTIYHKVAADNKDYFLKEKQYASRFDGDIKIEKITEKTYDKAVLQGENVKNVNLEDADLGVRNQIKQIQEEI